MKTRTGFVSNSSSSSFICDVCGEEACGRDICLSDCEMSQCVNGHMFCDDHMIGNIESITLDEKKQSYINDYCSQKDKIMKMPDAEFEEIWEEDGEYLLRNGVPERFCPCCQFKSVSNSDMIAYLLKKVEMDAKGFAKKLKDEFGTYEKFSEFVK